MSTKHNRNSQRTSRGNHSASMRATAIGWHGRTNRRNTTHGATHGATRNPTKRALAMSQAQSQQIPRQEPQAGRTAARQSALRRHTLWLNALLVIVCAVFVGALAVRGYDHLQRTAVERITVTGELERTQAKAVKALVEPAIADGFLRADLQVIREQLQSLPWIFKATVRRHWPNALEIHVVEQLPIARWGDQGFLNHEGGIFRTDTGEAGQDLPRLRGPSGSAQVLVAKYQRLVELLAPLELRVSELGMDERGHLDVELEGGMHLSLGNTAFLARVHRFVALYRRELAGQQAAIASVDLRYASGAAVAFRRGTEDTALRTASRDG